MFYLITCCLFLVNLASTVKNKSVISVFQATVRFDKRYHKLKQANVTESFNNGFTQKNNNDLSISHRVSLEVTTRNSSINSYISFLPTEFPNIQANSLDEISFVSSQMFGGSIIDGPVMATGFSAYSSDPYTTVTGSYIICVENDDHLKMVSVECSIIDSTIFLQALEARSSQGMPGIPLSCETANLLFETGNLEAVATSAMDIGYGLLNVMISVTSSSDAASDTPTTMPTTMIMSIVPTTTPSATRVPSVMGVPTRLPSTVPSIRPTRFPTFKPTSTPTVPIYQIYTVVGNGTYGTPAESTVVATAAPVKNIQQVSLDFSENDLYYADEGNRQVRKVSLYSGISSVVVGDGADAVWDNNGDGGPASSAQMHSPVGVAMASSGVLYVGDPFARRIRKVDINGIISVYAGAYDSEPVATASNGDGGPATSAVLNSFNFMFVDSAENLYFCDSYNNKVRKIDFNSQIISTIAGNGLPDSEGDNGAATAASIQFPFAVFADSQYDVYITENVGNSIRLVASDNIIYTFLPSVMMNGPTGIWGDTIGNIYFNDMNSHIVNVVSKFSNKFSTVAGNGAQSAALFVTTGVALSVPIIKPVGLVGDARGRLFIGDSYESTGGNCIRAIYQSTVAPTRMPTQLPSRVPSRTPSRTPSVEPSQWPSSAPTVPVYRMYTVAGNGIAGEAADRAVASNSSVRSPQGIFVDSTGSHLYFADSSNYRLRKIDLTSDITSIYAGMFNSSGSSGDGGPATSAQFTSLYGVCGSTGGAVFVSDLDVQRIRRIDSLGIISNYVGTGAASNIPTGPNGDGGAATAATVKFPRGVAVDSTGNLYFADCNIHKVRKVDALTQVISTVVGTGELGSTGGGGQATAATLNYPDGLFVNSLGVIYLSERTGFGIRKIDNSQIITIFADGAETAAVLENVPVSAVGVYRPGFIWGNTVGDIYFAHASTGRVRVISGFSGLVNTIAGSGGNSAAFQCCGVATTVAMATLRGISGDASGRVFVADASQATGGNTVRGIYASTATPTTVPTISEQPSLVPTLTPSSAPSSAPTASPSRLPSIKPSAAPSAMPSTLPTYIPSCAPTLVPSMVPSVTPTTTPTVVPSTVPSATPSTSPSTIPSITPSVVPSVTPTITPTKSPSAMPTTSPTNVPSYSPTRVPSAKPSALPSSAPTISPSSLPSTKPSATPSAMPTTLPTFIPSCAPSLVPSAAPSATPSTSPSIVPTITPSAAPSVPPTITPSVVPSTAPSATPSTSPSFSPSIVPSTTPSVVPSVTPTIKPTVVPSTVPSATPSTSPSIIPSTTPSADPSTAPSATPTTVPTKLPSYAPTLVPSAVPSFTPTIAPTTVLTTTPSVTPSTSPSIIPSATPSVVPSLTLTITPSVVPSTAPSATPSTSPSNIPSITPSVVPSVPPTITPTVVPSTVPSATPSTSPSIIPTITPSAVPSVPPTISSTAVPSTTPTTLPTTMPSCAPTFVPSAVLSFTPTITPTVSLTSTPSDVSSLEPTIALSVMPSVAPSASSTTLPSTIPTLASNVVPSLAPSSVSTSAPSIIPSIVPSWTPTTESTNIPSTTASTSQTSLLPTDIPNMISIPSIGPSEALSGSPSFSPASATPSMSWPVHTSTPIGTPSSSPTISSDSPTTTSFSPTASVPLATFAPSTTSSSSAPSTAPTLLHSNDTSSSPSAIPTSASSASVTNFPSIETCFPSFAPSTGPPSLMPSSLSSKAPTNINSQFLISSIAGSGATGSASNSGDDGPAMFATFNRLNGIAVDALGHIYVSDSLNNVVRKISAFTGIITTIAGDTTNTLTRIGDGGSATSATLGSPKHLYIDDDGHFLYVTDSLNFAVRKVDLQSGFIHLFAGSNVMPIAPSPAIGDGGPATSAKLKNPYGLWGDAANNMYISDNSYNNIRKVDTNGIISTIAGSVSGADGSSGNNAPATSALLFGPIGLWIDGVRSVLYFCDYSNLVVRSVDLRSHVISVVAGQTGLPGSSGDNGPATSAKLKNAISIWGDADRNVYLSDAGNCGLRKVSGSGGIISKLSGVYGVCTGQGDNGSPAISATHKFVYQITGDRANTLYLADGSIRKVRVIYDPSNTLSPITVPTTSPSEAPTTSFPNGQLTTQPTTKPSNTAISSLPPSASSSESIIISSPHMPTFPPTTTSTHTATPSTTPFNQSLSPTNPTLAPGIQPTLQPSLSGEPSTNPSDLPTWNLASTVHPTSEPTERPTFHPTDSGQPSLPQNSAVPTEIPGVTTSSLNPSLTPTHSETNTIVPSLTPSEEHSSPPSTSTGPTLLPTISPTREPTLSHEPTTEPSMPPTAQPTITIRPTEAPTTPPSSEPSSSVDPSAQPTILPTSTSTPADSHQTSQSPSISPSEEPTGQSSVPLVPTLLPTPMDPTLTATCTPTALLISDKPSTAPSVAANVSEFSAIPTIVSTREPTGTPSFTITGQPTVVTPSSIPSHTTSHVPSHTPTIAVVSTAPPTFTTPQTGTDGEVVITESGRYTISNHNEVYFVNVSASSRVVFQTISGSVGNVSAVRQYLIHPAVSAWIEIETFSNQSDVINLSAFTAIRALSDLNITRGSVRINLPNNQVVKLNNLQPGEVTADNFKFYSEPVTVATNRNNVKLSAAYIGLISALSAILLAFLAYIARIAMRHYYKSQKLSNKVASLNAVFPVVETNNSTTTNETTGASITVTYERTRSSSSQPNESTKNSSYDQMDTHNSGSSVDRKRHSGDSGSNSIAAAAATVFAADGAGEHDERSNKFHSGQKAVSNTNNINSSGRTLPPSAVDTARESKECSSEDYDSVSSIDSSSDSGSGSSIVISDMSHISSSNSIANRISNSNKKSFTKTNMLTSPLDTAISVDIYRGSPRHNSLNSPSSKAVTRTSRNSSLRTAAVAGDLVKDFPSIEFIEHELEKARSLKVTAPNNNNDNKTHSFINSNGDGSDDCSMDSLESVSGGGSDESD